MPHKRQKMSSSSSSSSLEPNKHWKDYAQLLQNTRISGHNNAKINNHRLRDIDYLSPEDNVLYNRWASDKQKVHNKFMDRYNKMDFRGKAQNKIYTNKNFYFDSVDREEISGDDNDIIEIKTPGDVEKYLFSRPKAKRSKRSKRTKKSKRKTYKSKKYSK